MVVETRQSFHFSRQNVWFLESNRALSKVLFGIFYHLFSVTDDTHMTCPIFRNSTPLIHLRPKFFHSLDLGRLISKESPLFQIITNQLKKSIIQQLLLYVIWSFFQVGFRFQYQLINLFWFSFDFFSFS